MKLPISYETVKNICAMLQRAMLTRAQAAEYFAYDLYDESQYDSVITQMKSIENRCKSIIGSIRVTDKVYKIPDYLIEDANKISKAFLAISALDKTRA